VIGDGVAANGDIAIEMGDVHRDDERERRRR